jgi:hypothetical protein
MSNQGLPVKFAQTVELTIPPFKERPEVHLNFSQIDEGEKRLREAQYVNPSTYSELEFTYGEGYRQARTHITVIGYEMAQTDKIIRRLKAEYLLDEYPKFLKESGIKDNASIRDAFLEKQADYVAAVDRLNALKALEQLMENKVRVFENVSRYMKKQMDILIRSGINPDKY